jgi:hypothetical protein
MPDARSLIDRVMDFVDRHLGGVITGPSHIRNRDRGRDSGSAAFGADASGGAGAGFDDCAGDGGSDCGGGDSGGGGD